MSEMKSILIMAAGNGSRYGTLKQFDELGPAGEFLFEFSVYDAIAEGFDHVVLITKKEHVEILHAYLRQRIPNNIQLVVLAQEVKDLPEGVLFQGIREKPWGTAHAVWTARKIIKDHFVVINADDYYGRTSMKRAMVFITGNREKLVFGSVPYILSETLSKEGSVSRAVCLAKDDSLSQIVEYLEVVKNEKGLFDIETNQAFSGHELTSMNFWIFTPEVFTLINRDLKDFVNSISTENSEEIYIPRQVQKWISTGEARVKLTDTADNWFGITYTNDKEKAKKELLRKTEDGVYSSPLWNHFNT